MRKNAFEQFILSSRLSILMLYLQKLDYVKNYNHLEILKNTLFQILLRRKKIIKSLHFMNYIDIRMHIKTLTQGKSEKVLQYSKFLKNLFYYLADI